MNINKYMIKFSIKKIHWLDILLIVFSIFTAFQLILLNKVMLAGFIYPCTQYNNYVIFIESFKHLIQGTNLYQLYPLEYCDYYKYSPTFAAGMFIFYYLPIPIGLIIWNLINCWLLWRVFKKFNFVKKDNLLYIFIFIFFELATSIQNSQSNGFITTCILLYFLNVEKKAYFIACLFIVLSMYIKIYSILAILTFFMYPHKLKFILYTLFWGVILFLLPIFFTSFEHIIQEYRNWYILLKEDHTNSVGISLAGIIFSITHIDFKSFIFIIGIILLLTPLLRVKNFIHHSYRLLYLAFILIWMVIFNHKAESPTYIIAIIGIAIWFFNKKTTRLDIGLIILCFVFTNLSSTDLFPNYLKIHFIKPYFIKALFPCIIWFKIWYELHYFNYNHYVNFKE